MKKTLGSAFIVAIMLCSSATLFGYGHGQVRMEVVYPNYYHMLTGAYNQVNIFISNDAPIRSMKLAFELTYSADSLNFHTPFGSKPAGQPYVMEYGDATVAFGPAGLQVDTSQFPARLIITAEAGDSLEWLPSTLSQGVARYAICIEAGMNIGTYPNGVCIRPILEAYSGGSSWYFNDSTEYAPDFMGQPAATASAACWDLLALPGIVPVFDLKPPLVVNLSHCQNYSFTFTAHDAGNFPPLTPIRFYCPAGTMGLYTGLLELPPPVTCGTMPITVWAVDAGGDHSQYHFTLNWTDSGPAIKYHPTSLGRVRLGTSYFYDFHATDPDACDNPEYSVSAVGTAPAGTFSVDAQGNFTFTPAPADDQATFNFRLTATDNCQAFDSSHFSVKVAQPTMGDCDGNESINISDVVSLISYIFTGGLPPNPASVGDVNCDSTTNISDAVYLIGFIFLGGPAPCSI